MWQVCTIETLDYEKKLLCGSKKKNNTFFNQQNCAPSNIYFQNIYILDT